ncbi:anti-anti-sigma regulatory factor [Actinoplanes octamycinicus]|uniref:Anti-anti-sigma regulatory factor n=1 Tax=Actinoplanes octamycinicus TaxID=135948 RepID=A0A7W7GZR5_9ACTN|nr:ATP-binding protein [Actinoplanes octamycinicus]MBB4741321.1 anti-anti-sigma regulatory factor [Actinoplanes octamycinicus]
MAAISCAVSQVGTRTLVRIHGELSTASAPQVRTILLKCLVERPDAVIAELAGLRVLEPVALSVFGVVARQAAMWPGTPLLLSAPGREVATWFSSGRYGRVPVLASTAEALDVEPRERMPALADSLLPVAGAAAHARRLAAEACARWGLDELTDAARIVAGELVTNAMVHAGTMIDLRFSLGRRYLMITVRDGSREMPEISPMASVDPLAPRGLLLVEQFARRWGAVPAEGGKVVWASLSGVPEPGARRSGRG